MSAVQTGRRAPGPGLYDDALADPAHYMNKSSFETIYVSLYEAALALVPRKASSVTELGCRTGQFAYLFWLGWPGPASYLGVDDSAKVIEKANERLPSLCFEQNDLLPSSLPGGDAYVALHILDRVEDDRALVESLPLDSSVVLSVPSFDTGTNVRAFPREADAIEHYQDLVEVSHWQRLPLLDDFVHLLAGRRRSLSA